MMEIVRGTTPILVFTFDTITPSDITVAILTIKQNGAVKVAKDLSSASVGEHDISWQLSQEDTLSLCYWSADIYCDWKLGSGVRGASHTLKVNIVEPGKNEVI